MFVLGRLSRAAFCCPKTGFCTFLYMLVLTEGQTAETIIVTLNEKRTLSDGFYLFYFENITTRQTATKVYAFAEDESSYTTRYNQFTINTSTVFANKTAGEWVYKVYESATSTTDPTGLTEVEYGILKLNQATEFAFEAYNEATSFKTYAG